MTIRIALAGMTHESNTFSTVPTDLVDFEMNGWYEGDQILAQSGTNTVIGGAVDAVRGVAAVQLLPLVATGAIPGGVVTAHAAREIGERIVGGLVTTRPDAVVLDLHGAMVTETADDGDGELLAKVRATVGPAVPIVAVLDLHANVSPEMVALADVLLPYDTYPHADKAERGAEAIRLAAAIAGGDVHPVTAQVKLPMLPPGPKQFSAREPTRSIMAQAAAFERQPGVVNVGVCFAYAYADCPFAGVSVIATTDGDQPRAEQIARELADSIWAVREEFRPDLMTVEEAVHAAIAEPAGPVILADLGDNPGGGSACDGTALLWALLDLSTRDAAIAVIVDHEALEIAFDAGEGAEIALDLGGKTDDLHGFPVPVVANVQSLSNGEFIYEGPMNRGRHATLGRTAVLACRGRHGNTVEVIVCERRMQPYDAAIFRSQGIEPANRHIVVVKSTVHFRGSFGPIAHRIIEVDTPGLTATGISRFPYQRLPRPMWPLDPM